MPVDNEIVLVVEPGKEVRAMKLSEAEKVMGPLLVLDPIRGMVPMYDLPMIYSGRQVITLGKDRFLYGKAMIYKPICDGDIGSVSSLEIQDVKRIFEMQTVTLCADGQDFPAFRI